MIKLALVIEDTGKYLLETLQNVTHFKNISEIYLISNQKDLLTDRENINVIVTDDFISAKNEIICQTQADYIHFIQSGIALEEGIYHQIEKIKKERPSNPSIIIFDYLVKKDRASDQFTKQRSFLGNSAVRNRIELKNFEIFNKIFYVKFLRNHDMAFIKGEYSEVDFAIRTYAKTPNTIYLYQTLVVQINPIQQNYKIMLEHLKRYELAIANLDGKFQNIAAKIVMNALYTQYGNRLNIKAKFEIFTLLNQLTEKYSFKVEKLKSYSKYSIPFNLFVFAVGREDVVKVREKFENQIAELKFPLNLKIITEENLSDFSHAKIKAALSQKSYEVVNSWLKLNFLYDFGGVAVDPDMNLDYGFMEFYKENTLVYEDVENSLSQRIFSSDIESDFVLSLIGLYTYHIFEDEKLPLAIRMKNHLNAAVTINKSLSKTYSEHVRLKFMPPFSALVKIDDDLNIAYYSGSDEKVLMQQTVQFLTRKWDLYDKI